MSWYKDYGMSSRFTKSAICPNPQDKEVFIDFLCEYGKKLNQKAVLFATSDLFLLPTIENKEKLEAYYHLPISDWQTVSNLLKKEYLYKLAHELGIPAPKSFTSYTYEEFKDITEKIAYPIIVKPSVNIHFTKHFGEKALIFNSKKALDNSLPTFKTFDFASEPLIVQDFIPGDVKTLYTITCYADRNKQIKGYSIGHKIRQFPPETGTIISGKVTHVDEILESAQKFIQATGFHGISNIEFKKDERDGIYKLMEINPRTGVWNLSALECGVNLPLLAYNDYHGNPVNEVYNEDKELIWMNTPMDLFYALRGYKTKGYEKFSISFKEWRKSVKGKKVDACFKWYDPMPFIKGFFMKYR
jgi:predicted ATP-grasp superfamily ATP-dependent carboligase